MSRYVFVESNTTGTGAIALRMLRARGDDVTFLTRDRARYPFLEDVRVVDADTNDLASLASRVEQLAPDAIVTFSTFYVATVAALASQLGLRFLNERTASICHDKLAARRALHAAGLPNPSFWEITSPADATRVSYPCVMKPSADSGSNGVLLISNEHEFLDHYARLSSAATNDRGQSSSGVLAESLLDGPEFSVESFTFDGAAHILGITRKHLSPPPHFVEIGHDFPAPPNAALESCVLRALGAVGYDFGPAHTEVRLTFRGPVIVEINPRLAGGMIPELVRLATGIDLIASYLDALIGVPPSLTPRRARTASIRFLVAPRAGTLHAPPRYDDLLAMPGVDAIEVTARIGTTVSPPRSAYDRLGYAICDSAERADRVISATISRMTVLVERRDRGTIRHESSVYGTSVDGIPLQVYRPDAKTAEVVIVASIHGDEAETTVVVSEALRCLPRGALRAAVILCANPDGMVRGTRGNARGVDLNRNFPTSNWSADPVYYKSRAHDARDIQLTTGAEPASEPETRALLALLDALKPRAVVSLHSALACIDDSGASHLGRQLAERCALPFLTEIGYPTPGSMGTWAGEQGLNLVTLELEDASLYTLKDRHVPILLDLMTGRFELEAR